MRKTPADAGGARGEGNQPKKSFIPSETVAAVSSVLRLFAVEEVDAVVEAMPRPQRAAAVRLRHRHGRELAAVRILDDFRRDVMGGDHVADRLVCLVVDL